MRYARIEKLRQHHAVAAMCRILEVSESGYHAWRQRPSSARTQENHRLETEVKAAHRRTRETYGPERLRSDLLTRPLNSLAKPRMRHEDAGNRNGYVRAIARCDS